MSRNAAANNITSPLVWLSQTGRKRWNAVGFEVCGNGAVDNDYWVLTL
jgi:hypothetical protein